jgi:hypothetical protein
VPHQESTVTAFIIDKPYPMLQSRGDLEAPWVLFLITWRSSCKIEHKASSHNRRSWALLAAVMRCFDSPLRESAFV